MGTDAPATAAVPPRAARAFAAALAAGWLAITWPQVLGVHATPHLAPALAGFALTALLAVAFAPAARAVFTALERPPRWAFLALVALASVALSQALTLGPMRDRVLAVDSSVYVLQARALAHGSFGVPLPVPRLPFSTRFLFEGADGRMHGVFPPGFPLFLAPFVWLGRPLWAAPALAALLAVAVYTLARVATGEEKPARLAPLLALPAWGRAVETADLLSHSFVAALAAFALAVTLRLCARPSRPLALALALGACVGWALAARLLDGVVLGAVCAALLAGAALVRRAVPPRYLLMALLAAAPFVLLVAAQQHAASGRWTVPSQHTYFVRSDWPHDCHRLGVGATVGCHVEHPIESDAFGPDGYTLDDAVRVGRERAEESGNELFSVGALALGALCVAVAWPLAPLVACAAFVLALTLAYGLFYYGNNDIFGARHVFPAAPCLWTLLAAGLARLPGRRASAARWLDAPHARGAAVLAVLAGITAGQVPRWREKRRLIVALQSRRVDARRAIAEAGAPRGIIAVRDQLGYLAGFDPFTDGAARLVVEDDRAGLRELRRAHPHLPLYFALPDQTLARALLPPPPDELRVELEAAWPAFQRVRGTATVRLHGPTCCNITTLSGEYALFVFHAEPGGAVAIPFDVVRAGTYALRLDGVTAPDFGIWEVFLDGAPLTVWNGFAPDRRPLRGEAAPPRALRAGRHVLMAQCVGRAPQSAGYLAAFDALVGEPAP